MEKWRPVGGEAKYKMPWGWMWFIPRGAKWIGGTGLVGGLLNSLLNSIAIGAVVVLLFST
jgi:hypothetical protein